jgi:thioredoxin reductase
MSDVRDVLIVGGGPAGLSAALWLARYNRRVLVIDSDQPRNDPAWGVHGYPGIVDPSPDELRERIHDQAINAGAEYEASEVRTITGEKNEFVAGFTDGRELHARRVILAYGLRDHIPRVDGITELYGRSVFHCPDCDGPTIQDHDIGVLGASRDSANLALYLLHWAADVVLLTNGAGDDVPGSARAVLDAQGIRVIDAPVRRAVAAEGRLERVEFADAPALPLHALFFHLGSEPCCDIGEVLGCDRDDDGYISVDRGQETSVPGIHAVGDITGHPHLAIVAAAEGVRAALAIHRSLLPADRLLRSD